MDKIDTSEIWERIEEYSKPVPINIIDICRGNYIHNKNGFIVKVIGIDSKDNIFYKKDRIDILFKDHVSNFESIPLNDKLISEHTDFELKTGDGGACGEYTWLELETDTKFVSLNRLIEGRYTIENSDIYISSLHELQNVYKLSERKELNIKNLD